MAYVDEPSHDITRELLQLQCTNMKLFLSLQQHYKRNVIEIV